VKVYVAGSFSGRHRIQREAARLTEAGYIVLSRWFDDDYFVEKEWDKNFAGVVAQTMAEVDMYAIINADTVIVDTFEPSSTGGRYVELGAAVMRNLVGKPLQVVVIGPATNIFETLVTSRYVSWNAFFTFNNLRRDSK